MFVAEYFVYVAVCMYVVCVGLRSSGIQGMVWMEPRLLCGLNPIKCCVVKVGEYAPVQMIT